MNPRILFEHLQFQTVTPTPEIIHEIAQIYKESFLSLNAIWKNLKIPPTEAYEIMKERVEFAANVGIIYAMVQPTNGKIAMVTTGTPLKDYIYKKSLADG